MTKTSQGSTIIFASPIIIRLGFIPGRMILQSMTEGYNTFLETFQHLGTSLSYYSHSLSLGHFFGSLQYGGLNQARTAAIADYVVRSRGLRKEHA